MEIEKENEAPKSELKQNSILNLNKQKVQPDVETSPDLNVVNKTPAHVLSMPQDEPAVVTNACLLVRDDSILLNRSSNLSSSSITEVSSLMPSNGNKLMDSPYNANPARKMCGNILNATHLAENIVLDDEENNYRRLALNNRSNRSSKLYENNNFNSDISTVAPFFFNDTSFMREQEAFGRKNVSTHNIRQSTRSSAVKVQTVGEIMEPSRLLTATSNQSSRSVVNTVNINDSSASSFSSVTADSGRDSIESPLNNTNNTTNNNNLANKQSNIGKPFIIGLQSTPSSILLEPNHNHTHNSVSSNAFFLNPNQATSSETSLRLAQSTHILDTRC